MKSNGSAPHTAGFSNLDIGSPGSPPAEPSPAEVDAAVLNFLDANLKK